MVLKCDSCQATAATLKDLKHGGECKKKATKKCCEKSGSAPHST